jgi:NAD(P)H dehydrogenase (quinone)
MKCLVVVAHPLKTSLCVSLAKTAIETLSQCGHTVEVLDLYERGFSPALTQAERASYYGEVFDRRELEADIEQLQSAEILVLVFPTWWFGLPAILKGWFDRVWAPGAAYDHASDLGSIKPRLNQLRRTMAVTTLGAPWWIDYFVLRRPVRRQLKFALLGTCAPKSSFEMLSLHKSEKLTANSVEQFKRRIDATIRRWR